MSGRGYGPSSAGQPHTRSRTNLFLSYRDSAVRTTTSASARGAYDYNGGGDHDETRGLMGGMEETVLDMAGAGGALPPQWVDISDQVDAVVDSVKPKLIHLSKLHAKHILPGFKDRTAEEREIEALTSEITRDFRSTQKHIRRIAELSKQLLKSPLRPGESQESRRLNLIMAANVQTALATKVQDLSSGFRKKQSEYLKSLRANGGSTTPSATDNHASLHQGDPLFQLAEDESYALSQSQSQTQSLRTANGTIDIAQRDQEINAIAQNITDLSDLFKDLSSMVIDQGTLLDRVDWNVEQMGTEVKKAVDELKVATVYQKRSGKCQLIFLLLLLIFGAILVLVYKPRGGGTPAPTPTGDEAKLLPSVGSDIDIEVGGGLLGSAGGAGAPAAEPRAKVRRRRKRDGPRRLDRRGGEAYEWPFRET